MDFTKIPAVSGTTKDVKNADVTSYEPKGIEGKKLYGDVKQELEMPREQEHEIQKYLKKIMRDNNFVQEKNGESEGQFEGQIEAMHIEHPGFAEYIKKKKEQQEQDFKNFRTDYEEANKEIIQIEAQAKKLEEQKKYLKAYMEEINKKKDMLKLKQKKVDLDAYDDTKTNKRVTIGQISVDELGDMLKHFISSLKN
jgi:chromosome segregation ATPase